MVTDHPRPAAHAPSAALSSDRGTRCVSVAAAHVAQLQHTPVVEGPPCPYVRVEVAGPKLPKNADIDDITAPLAARRALWPWARPPVRPPPPGRHPPPPLPPPL